LKNNLTIHDYQVCQIDTSADSYNEEDAFICQKELDHEAVRYAITHEGELANLT